ncbi:MAG: hypothetical protein V3R29_09725, partial [Candidatus Acidoferrales bacterium]
GRRDPDGLTQIVAHVVLRNPPPHSPVTPSEGEGSAFSACSPELGDELRTFVKQRLPSYKCPQHFEFVPELPKTATGKIQRFKLRTQE